VNIISFTCLYFTSTEYWHNERAIFYCLLHANSFFSKSPIQCSWLVKTVNSLPHKNLKSFVTLSAATNTSQSVERRTPILLCFWQREIEMHQICLHFCISTLPSLWLLESVWTSMGASWSIIDLAASKHSSCSADHSAIVLFLLNRLCNGFKLEQPKENASSKKGINQVKLSIDLT
jgi:hypothetical protein